MRNIKEIVSHFMPESALGGSVGDTSSERLGGDDRTNLTRRVSESAAKPISELTTADVATMLRQEVGGDFALALALMIISEEPLICGDSYSGDILKLALERDWQAWLRTEKYGVDPYWLISSVESTVSGLRTLSAELEDAFKKNFSAID